jgi:hypothetical protein
MPFKPLSSEPCSLFQGPGFLEEMGCAGNDLQFLLSGNWLAEQMGVDPIELRIWNEPIKIRHQGSRSLPGTSSRRIAPAPRASDGKNGAAGPMRAVKVSG